MIEAILIVISILLVLQLILVLWNKRYFIGAPQHDDSTSHLKVSVLIPARNEEANIDACLTHVFKQSKMPYEVIVLNDHSTDQTSEILDDWQNKQDKLKVLDGKSLPEDWLGKSFACYQLSQEASGDWFLFLDADTRIEEHAIASLLPVLDQQQKGIVSGFPRQITKTLIEKLVVPMMMVTIMLHLPIKWVQTRQDYRFAAAHGGFIAVEKASYQNSGGHKAIKSSLVDDMELFKLIKKSNDPARLLKVDDIVSMRMYHGFRSVWLGYQKNMFAGVNRSVFLLVVVMVYYFVLFILPLMFIGQASLTLIALLYLLGVIIKMLIDVTNKVPFWISFLMPISVLLFIAIGVDSMIRSLTKQGYNWKGRRYS
ncbi:Glycosyltransferase, catalytic subunit of cellulose synthase and poly-beta-1,6-N-acetylglucosamine synthase [Pelagirhabdus alkalitolerans]|uniref:4,4'-diaponeurosporenoate glycosyltransferase n=1 Tax=Pelagirhabdus alkalitolerans TaxID=1612202 RepID=A0A1G6H9I4_9BACI|nr:glycosyltransferase family 2 protein [Pelagirhabdus alkalitolerans]SDB90605.1 Glycosyltransferase, catalytic subunit of cellulose synthase and poly-beta-1,6-N-acetylglucosamine synthase [Pelagirhabdus alkalitolerans]